jgi:DNA-binding Xre family transcriptional regulator
MTTTKKVEILLRKTTKTDLAKELAMSRTTLNERIQNDTWKKLEIEKINQLNK